MTSPHGSDAVGLHHRRRRIGGQRALAARLSADPTTRAGVLEAGRSDYSWDPLIHMPAALTFPIGSPLYDWRPGPASFRGADGPLVLERGPADGALFRAFFAAAAQAGYPLTDDVNGYQREGFAPFDRNISGGRRLSAARAYLHPAMSRPNLRVVTRAHTTKILFDGTRATGVEFALRYGGVPVKVELSPRRAYGGEVIVCAGALGSPQLLQRSGVGNAAELEELDIPVVADLPGVGENLQDHLEVYVQYGSEQPVSVAPALRWRNRPGVALRWLLARSGPGATNHFEGGGFARSTTRSATPT